jgi:hypothetical protein
LNVWAGIVDNHLIGPHILPNRLRVDNFLNFLENELDNLLDPVPLATRRDMRIQMDGAGPHYAIPVREWFNNSVACQISRFQSNRFFSLGSSQEYCIFTSLKIVQISLTFRFDKLTFIKIRSQRTKFSNSDSVEQKNYFKWITFK